MERDSVLLKDALLANQLLNSKHISAGIEHRDTLCDREDQIRVRDTLIPVTEESSIPALKNKTCPVCKETINETFVEANNTLYHPDCFV